MVLDKLIDPKTLRDNPLLTVVAGFFFVLVAFVSTKVAFPSEFSIIVVAFASMLAVPYILKILEFDELNIDLAEIKNAAELDRIALESWARKCLRDGYSVKQIRESLIQNNLNYVHLLLYDLQIINEINLKYLHESNFMSRHRNVIKFYCLLFFGMFLAYFTLYTGLSETSREVVFKHQLNLIYGYAPAGYVNLPFVFYDIVSNNLKVMMLCLLLSLLYGSGAILILSYNASIAGVLFGGFARAMFLTKTGPLTTIIAYLPHTSIEIFAYLLAAISGGIISKAVAGAEVGSTKILFKDGLLLFILALILVVVGGYVEITVPAMLVK